MSAPDPTVSTPARPVPVQASEQDDLPIDTGSRVRRQLALFALLAILGIAAVMASLSWSSVSIPVGQVVTILLGGEAEKSSWQTIVMDIRLPRVLTAMLVGTALGLAGLQMQTVFRNPLASPFTLGVSSGASLGVALVILVSPTSAEIFSGLGGSFFTNLGTVAGAALGAAAVLSVMLVVASRVGDMVVVLLLGVVMAALIGAVVTILIFFANEQQTREFVEWGLGSFNRVRWGEMPYMSSSIGVALIMAVLTIKPLNALLLGDNYAQSMGLNVKWARVVVMGKRFSHGWGGRSLCRSYWVSWHCHTSHRSRRIRHVRPSDPGPRLLTGRNRNRVSLRNTRRTSK